MRLRWRVVGLAGALAAAAALVIAYLPSQPLPTAPGRAAVSMALKPERRVLADGSSIELNAGAEIEVAFSAESRAVRLTRGEALFAVVRDSHRPFVVTAGAVTVRAVGTEFAVRLAVDEVGVLVTEGRVAVEPTTVTVAAAVDPAKPAADTVPAAAPVVYVDAGNRLTVPVAAPAAALPRPSPVSAMEAQAALAWRGMRIEFTNTPLAEVVALFNRHNRTELAVGTVDVGEIRISGIFWADDPEGFARLLEASAGLRADHSSAGRIVLRR
jgi:transmembrane sensor